MTLNKSLAIYLGKRLDTKSHSLTLREVTIKVTNYVIPEVDRILNHLSTTSLPPFCRLYSGTEKIVSTIPYNIMKRLDYNVKPHFKHCKIWSSIMFDHFLNLIR